jgi:hypothetical protein
MDPVFTCTARRPIIPFRGNLRVREGSGPIAIKGRESPLLMELGLLINDQIWKAWLLSSINMPITALLT